MAYQITLSDQEYATLACTERQFTQAMKQLNRGQKQQRSALLL